MQKFFYFYISRYILSSACFHSSQGKYSVGKSLKPWNFPGGTVVKNTSSNSGDMDSIPGWGTKTPQMMEVYWTSRSLPNKIRYWNITENRLLLTGKLKISRTINNKYVWCHNETFTIKKHTFLKTINSIYKIVILQNANIKGSL